MLKVGGLISSLIILFSSHAFASTKDEIQHLLAYVATTDCQYERNGTLYNGTQAVEHIKRKYDYYQDDIQSAEAFIEYSATKSAISGKEYVIHCAGHEAQKSRVWLSAELDRFRGGQK